MSRQPFRERGRGFSGSRGRGRGSSHSDSRFRKSLNSEDQGQTKFSRPYEGDRSQMLDAQGQGKNKFPKNYQREGQPREPRGMSYGRLKSWAESEDPEDLALFMSHETKQIEIFLNQDSIKEDWYNLFVLSVHCMISAQLQKSAVNKILDLISNTPFLEKHLAAFVFDKISLNDWHGGQSFLEAMHHILESILRVCPSNTIKIITAIPQLINFGKVYELDDMVAKLSSLGEKASKLYKLMKEQPVSRHGLTSVGEVPPDDYLQASVLPTCKDITEDRNIFLRPIVLDGGYKDKDHYLDVQFRLMKQDFIIPLREGIREFKKNGMKKHFNSSDLRMYYGVHILGLVTHDGIDHVLQFDISKLKSVRWDFSKRLIFGSLVCLSKDGFKSIAIATISNRDPKDLKNGHVNVNVKSGLDIVFNSTSNDEFVMAETVAYFESYYHVLEGLQEMCENLPLQEYIVSCDKKVKPPQYLLGGTSSPSYDLGPFMKDTCSLEVPVLITTKWPSSDKMCLNQSQREAAQMALTKRLAVIQGPPGTGKTYVGLKVVQTILSNQLREAQINSSSSKSSPILVVCYTNHALDQFLGGILQFCEKGIVRVGGRSKSDCLEPYNLKNIRKAMKIKKELACITVEKARRECHWRLKNSIEEIDETYKQLEQVDCGSCSQENLLKFDVMSEDHRESLLNGNQDGYTHTRNALSRWLNARNEDPVKDVARIIEANMTRLILQGKFEKIESPLNPQMSIEARATFYLHKIAKLMKQLTNQIHELQCFKGFEEVDEQIERHFYRLELCNREIVHDNVIRLVMEPKEFKKIKEFLGRREFPNECVKAWLLGLHQEQHKQLNEIESLTVGGLKSNFQTQQDTKIDDIKIVEEDCDDDTDFDREYLEKTKALRNSFTSIIHRLDELGLDEPEMTRGPEDGWQRVTKPLSYSKMRKKIRSAQKMLKEQEDSVTNIWELNTRERFSLYKLWMERYRKKLSAKMEILVEKYECVLAEKNEIIGQETVSILRNASVIGMTTTGAAKHRSVLQAVGCRIIVVEEAAEVLEAHIVTALNKHCEHLILIGDHQQLRPSPVVYELAKDYGLDISLFERLVKNQFPHVVLQEQHRMRPEISKIMCHIYPDLRDHPVVSSYEHVQGVVKDLFFVQHKESESSVEDTRSKANEFEASYATKLFSYLVLQGYKPSQITILATYAGQVLAIRNSFRLLKLDYPVQVTSVDNFQGEENDIIILSLVRSNEDNKIGFLKEDNRVCVALSRAKKGLYIIGNLEFLASKSKLWHQILLTAQSEGNIGEGLPVVCCNHPEEGQALMFNANDFDSRVLGGCGLPCTYRLNCGHLCELTCHGFDQLHEDYHCKKPCTKLCSQGHPCHKKCFEDCGKCPVKILKVIPNCGHEDLVPCHLSPQDAICSQPCEVMLQDCEHQCSGKCGHCKKNGKHRLCEEPVHYLWPCGHLEKVKCHQKPLDHPCPHPCDALLECGHKCKGTCSKCLQGKVHLACGELCEKKLPCGHPCQSLCSESCKPCSRPCPSKCRHGICRKSAQNQLICGHTCIPCKEKCLRHCKCHTCNKYCSDICDNQPCDKSCKKKLKCSHPCSGICGELCVCFTCSKIYFIKEQIEIGNVKEKNMWINEVDKKNLESILVKAGIKDESLNSSPGLSNSELGDTREGDTACTGDRNTQEVVTVSNTELYEDRKPNQSPVKRLLLKVPICDHVFYVDELDWYVNNYEPRGTSFIPCPICERPIQNCTRYEHINLKRAIKREKMKEVLRKQTEVLYQEKEALKENLEASSKLVHGFEKVDPYAVKYKSEILALSFKLKLTFVLNEIDSLRPYIVDESEFSQMILTRKNAVLQIKNYVTEQQKREFLVEFAHILCRAVIIKIKDISANEVDDDLSSCLTKLKQKQEVQVLGRELDRFLESVEEDMNSLFEMQKKRLSSSTDPALTLILQYDVIKKHVKSVLKVLRSDDTKFLSAVIASSTISSSGVRPKERTKIDLTKRMKFPVSKDTKLSRTTVEGGKSKVSQADIRLNENLKKLRSTPQKHHSTDKPGILRSRFASSSEYEKQSKLYGATSGRTETKPIERKDSTKGLPELEEKFWLNFRSNSASKFDDDDE
ncbi:hypothetical protein EGW08_023046 [Elysia chlorotica]|uniref:NFX1-type zinc finger-containing protein 1 n=1 Tax=Elysia chlorotica TaxID=188477 RepID=A0A3S0ZK01_ELYCH|nr:hypothetical protein EGW08_023046 [Elysia chlorotica]